MNTIKTIVRNISELKGCWLYEKRRYAFEGKFHYLPTTSLENKEVLDVLGLPYRTIINYYNCECLEYWDPEYEEYEEKKAPLFFRASFSLYQFIGKYYVGYIPTKKMQQMAVLKELDFKKALLLFNNFKSSKRHLAGNLAAFYTNYTYYENPIIWKGEEIKTYSIPLNSFLGNYHGIILFDVTKIKSDKCSTVTLELPEGYKKYAGLIIGKNGYRVKSWAEELGVKKIIVQ